VADVAAVHVLLAHAAVGTVQTVILRRTVSAILRFCVRAGSAVQMNGAGGRGRGPIARSRARSALSTELYVVNYPLSQHDIADTGAWRGSFGGQGLVSLYCGSPRSICCLASCHSDTKSVIRDDNATLS
jgi:hypothetical protein